MTKPRIAALLLLPILLALPGCGDHRDDCYETPHCQSFVYLKDGVDEAHMLADEKRLRAESGVQGVRARLDGSTAVLTVFVAGKRDIQVREQLLKLGYHRRW